MHFYHAIIKHLLFRYFQGAHVDVKKPDLNGQGDIDLKLPGGHVDLPKGKAGVDVDIDRPKGGINGDVDINIKGPKVCSNAFTISQKLSLIALFFLSNIFMFTFNFSCTLV